MVMTILSPRMGLLRKWYLMAVLVAGCTGHPGRVLQLQWASKPDNRLGLRRLVLIEDLFS